MIQKFLMWSFVWMLVPFTWRDYIGMVPIWRKNDLFWNVEFDILEEHPERIFQKEHVYKEIWYMV